MTVPCASGVLNARCSPPMPRICPPSGNGSDSQTPAFNGFTDGSHTVGGMPVSVVKPLDSNATPAPAVVSVPAQIVRDQPVGGGDTASGPVPSHQRTAPAP